MHDTKDAPAPTVQVAETLSEKRSRASQKRWTKARALELGLALLEGQRESTPAITPAKEPPPTDPAIWQAKLREVFWTGLLEADEKVLGYLAKLFNISLVEELDLQLTPDEIELTRRLREWRALGPDEQHQELLKNFESAQVLPTWLAKWRWNPLLCAWVPRRQEYLCPHCHAVLYEFSPPESTPNDPASETEQSRPAATQTDSLS